MAEVEAQLVGADVGAGLAHVAAEALAQRGLQQVRGGVVALGRVAGDGGRRARARARPRCSSPCLDDHLEHPVLADPDDVLDARAAVAVGALDHADVGDLAAAGGVERRVGELDEQTRAARAVLAIGRRAATGRTRRRSSAAPRSHSR